MLYNVLLVVFKVIYLTELNVIFLKILKLHNINVTYSYNMYSNICYDACVMVLYMHNCFVSEK